MPPDAKYPLDFVGLDADPVYVSALAALESNRAAADPVSTSTPPTLHSDKPSIALLPFVNMSDDRQQDYFADGITESVIAGLSRFRDLFVIASNSTFAYQGKATKIQDASRELGARYILEGSVQKAKDRVRITAQLIDGKTGRHIWAERYERNLDDVFSVQDDVTERIIGSLATAYGGRLFKAWQERPEIAGTRNLQALDYFVRGVAAWPAAGFVDTEIRCLTELESGNAKKEVQPRVQA